MYEVMARRYRPAQFNEVVGQEHIAATLRNAILRDRVAHAYIFTGGHGCGKTTMARILAKALVCVHGPTPDPCGVCPICQDVAAGRDADVLEIDGASNNGIEQIRLLREQAAYVPTRARFKIYIIDEVHMLSDGAFNALLKTLEEPPRHVKFILATTDPHKVPDTILSRCQRFDFRLVPQTTLSAFFTSLAAQEHAAVADDALDAVAAFAEGSVRDGLVLLDQLLSFSDGRVTREDVEAVRGVASAESVAGLFSRIAAGDAGGALGIVGEVASRGTNVGDFLDQLIVFGRDLLLLAAGGGRDGVSAYGPAREALFALSGETDLETALLYLDVLTGARARVRMRALTNPLVALEMAVARLAGLSGVTPVSRVLAQLGQSRLADAPTPPESGAAPASRRDAPAPKPSAPKPSAPEPSAPEPAPVPAPRPVPKPEPAPNPEPDPAPDPAPAADMAPEAKPDPEPAPMPPPPVRTAPPQPPAEPPPSAAAVAELPPLTRDTVDKAWSKMLDDAAVRHPGDIRHMMRIAVADVDGDVIRMTGSATAVEQWQDAMRLGRLTELAGEALGRPVRFAFTERRAKRSQEQIASENQAAFDLARHPAVDKVRSLFGGVIVACEAAEREEPEADGGDGN